MYDRISRYYDQSQAAFTEDVPFLLLLAAETGDPILELGCGSGRLLLPLARAGYMVTGIDNSPAMLALAKAKLAHEEAAVRERVRLLPGEITHPYLPDEAHTMALVIVGINTFMHLDEPHALAALREVVRMLRPGGLLAIDVDNPFALADVGTDGALEEEQVWVDPETGHTVRQLAAYELAEDNQAVDVAWVFEEQFYLAEAPERTEIDMRYYFNYPHQFDLMFSRSGLRLVALYGDYARGPFSEDSDRLLLLASLP